MQIRCLNLNVLKTEYLNIGSDIQNMKLEDIEMKGSMEFKYLGSIFSNSGKCKEVLNGIEQARKATRALNILLWSKHVSLNTKKRVPLCKWYKAF
jgi:hypothetical protein